MTAILSSRGSIIIPEEVRDRCDLREGDHFVVDYNPSTQEVILRKVKPRGDWFDVYMRCRSSFDLPPRRRQKFFPKNPESVISVLKPGRLRTE